VDGHGTFVAGVVAAIDNGIGVAGVAPGARVWSVRVADRRGSVRGSYILCALDWVAEHADVVEVANLSLGGPGEDLGACGRDPQGVVLDPLHAAICSAVEAGVTVTVAAGNDAVPVVGTVPAAYDEVITVSAYADFDGLPGGLALSVCLDEPLPDLDDALAPFSNHGRDVDIAAPGVCIESTVPGGYAISDGTSIAAPFVAGAAALVKAGAPGASPAEVREILLAKADPAPIPLDPDPFPEPLLDIRAL
jgi:subtilisin family serine protease